MEIFKYKWFQLTIIIVILTAILFKVYNCIICNYPLWVKSQISLINKTDSKVAPLDMGTYGDMYGALNTLFSGLAFLGLLATIVIQIVIHYREQESEKKEKLEIASNKLVYLNLLVNQSLSEINAFKDGINDLIKNNSLEKKKTYFFKDENPIEYNKINLIVNIIDQEVFFTAYYQKFKQKYLIDLFVSFSKLLKSWQAFTIKINAQNEEYNTELSNLKNAYIYLKQKGIEALTFSENDPSFNPLASWYLFNSETLEYIEKRGNILEVYESIKEEYEHSIVNNNRFKEQEINTFLENCKSYITNIESIRQVTLNLCKTQIIEVEKFEKEITDVKIISP